MPEASGEESEDGNQEELENHRSGLCDGCHEEVPVDELMECPSSFDVVKHNIIINKCFCEDCCKEIFEFEGCQSDVGNCDRATEIMVQCLREYAEKKGFRKPKENVDVYFHKSETYCIGTHTISPQDSFKDEEASELDYFDGSDFLLVKFPDEIVSFSKELIGEIEEVIDDLGCYGCFYRFLRKKKLLVIYSDGIWSVLAPHINSSYDVERSKFIDKIREGSAFFGIQKDDGLVVLEYERLEFDWSKLDDRKFVELCCDILKSHPEMEQVQITDGTGDLGQDIRAVEVTKDLLGTGKREWTIQCKHFPSRKVSASDIADLANSYAQLKFDVFCLMTSNLLFPACIQMLKSWDKMEKYDFKTGIWDRKKIEDYLRAKPELYKRYFL